MQKEKPLKVFLLLTVLLFVIYSCSSPEEKNEGTKEEPAAQKLLGYDDFNIAKQNGGYYQYMQNQLQLNNGYGTYSEIGQLAEVSNTDSSWGSLFTDLGNDGWKDLFIANGYRRDLTNLDFRWNKKK